MGIYIRVSHKSRGILPVRKIKIIISVYCQTYVKLDYCVHIRLNQRFYMISGDIKL